ncbi:MAG: hypothetical protein RBS57_05890 [Desulforhabdus sp.]|nr:hypothetical protein [Desulforhabdus sp.]
MLQPPYVKLELQNENCCDEMVRTLEKIEPGPDFTKKMGVEVNEHAVTCKMQPQCKLSLSDRLFRFAEDFIELLSRREAPSTGTLDEFSDFPPLSMGRIYFRLMWMGFRYWIHG